MRFAVVLSLVLVFAASGAAPALAGRNFVVGVNEDAVKWRPGISSISTDLGLGYYRVTQGWQPGQTQLSDSDAASINEAVKNAGSQKILLSVFGSASAAPVGATSRAQYCSFVSSVLDRFPQIAAVNIWNEANLSYFWKPQFNRNGSSAAPAAYEALLARCFTRSRAGIRPCRMLTSLSPRGNDNPHAVSNISHSVKNFVAKLGQYTAARDRRRARSSTAGGRTSTARARASAPGARHRLDIGEGDYPRLLSYLRSAFRGTRQPVPGQKDVRIWYLEDGFQTGRPNQAILLPEQRDRPLARCRAGRRQGRSGLASWRRDQARVLPARCRRLLQLPARRRAPTCMVGSPASCSRTGRRSPRTRRSSE